MSQKFKRHSAKMMFVNSQRNRERTSNTGQRREKESAGVGGWKQF
jgi:hypothetical protein